MKDWFENDIFEFKTREVREKHKDWKTPSLEELIKECKVQIDKYGTCNDTGKFCFDVLCYLDELKNLKEGN